MPRAASCAVRSHSHGLLRVVLLDPPNDPWELTVRPVVGRAESLRPITATVWQARPDLPAIGEWDTRHHRVAANYDQRLGLGQRAQVGANVADAQRLPVSRTEPLDTDLKRGVRC